ncbi:MULTISPECIES: DUF4190 domain-containing protein [unclassified Solwaraspora]|uniref:DUF4190 domain-containing protein n=1 Tax=unclassified Solwaraspora TaxID=2627926 RepID=UPI00259B5D8F|nr:DUF4190 domain-containing protein [Solwaraspora sp. WMMA2056]WJK40870.1 DUF4190 domain-containing protein [Solwaraspora sp. WMMA2056]
MSQPQQPGNWSDPSWQGQQQPYGSYDPAGQVSGQPAAPGYPAYPDQQAYAPGAGYATPGYPAGYPYPVAVANPVNGRAIAALVLGILGILGLCGYFVPGLIGIVGALLGHSARRQIRTAAEQGRPEQGDGMAVAGMITGWISFGISLLASIVIAIAVIASISQNQ